MTSPPNRNQLQKQTSVDHADGEEDICTKADVALTLTSSQTDAVTNNNCDNNEELIASTESSKTSSHPIFTNDTRSQLVQEYRALEKKVNAMREKNDQENVVDDNKEGMLLFVVKTLSSNQLDRSETDRQHLFECNTFLEKELFANPSVIALSSESKDSQNKSDNQSDKFSVDWANEEPRARMVMHKLCAFYGLLHNIVGQQLSSTIHIEFDPASFIEWRCSIVEIARYIELRKLLDIEDEDDGFLTTQSSSANSESKTILKRTISHRQSSGRGIYNSNDNRSSFEDRQNTYYQVREKLGIHSDPKRNANRTVRQFQSMPTHDSSSREQLSRARMDAHPRSATTDGDNMSPVYIDNTYIRQHSDLSIDSIVPNSSTSDISLTSDSFSRLNHYPIGDNTRCFKLVPVDFNQISSDDYLYILPKEEGNPFLLLNNEGKPFRYTHNKLLSSSTSIDYYSKGSLGSPIQSSNSSAAHSISGTNNNAIRSKNVYPVDSHRTNVNKNNFHQFNQSKSMQPPTVAHQQGIPPPMIPSIQPTHCMRSDPSMVVPFTQPSNTPSQQHAYMGPMPYYAAYQLPTLGVSSPTQMIDPSCQQGSPMCPPQQAIIPPQSVSSPYYPQSMIYPGGYLMATSPMMVPQAGAINHTRLMHPHNFPHPSVVGQPPIQIPTTPGLIQSPAYMYSQASVTHSSAQPPFPGSVLSPVIPIQSQPNCTGAYNPSDGSGNASNNSQNRNPTPQRYSRPNPPRQSGSFSTNRSNESQ